MCGDCDYIAGFAGCFIEKHMTGGKSLPFLLLTGEGIDYDMNEIRLQMCYSI